MKNKIFAFGIVAIMVLSGGLFVVNAEKGGNGNGANDIPNGFHYTLNIIGKKSDWNGGGGYDNPDRSTIFVPEDTTTFHYDIELPDGTYYTKYGSVAIWFTQGQAEDMSVIDGNAFDDGWCQIDLAKGKYDVYICSRAKPGYSTEIDGMVYVEDSSGAWYLYQIGTLTVTRKWQDAHDLFWVTWQEDNLGPYGGVLADQSPEQWIFDYLNQLNGYTLPTGATLQDSMYFWDFDNNGNKLVKVRFYPTD